MSWLGLWHRSDAGIGQVFDSAGLSESGARGCLLLHEANALLARGTLMFELCLPETDAGAPLLLFERGGDWPLRLMISAAPQGGIEVHLDQYGHLLHHILTPLREARGRRLRLTLFWDAPAFRGHLALEHPGDHRAQIVEIEAPRPWRLADLEALLSGAPDNHLSDDLEMIALSDMQEPVGVMPGLAPETLMETERGPRPMAHLRRGDLLRGASGDLMPVLHVLRRQVPAFGSFAPVRLRAPGLGLRADLRLAPHQRVEFTGAEVEYHFGREAVLAPAEALCATRLAQYDSAPEVLATYMQVILPTQEVVRTAAGLGVETQFLGRLRRDRCGLAASLLADVNRNDLPEHAGSTAPVLRAFDAAVLMEPRSA